MGYLINFCLGLLFLGQNLEGAKGAMAQIIQEAPTKKECLKRIETQGLTVEDFWEGLEELGEENQEVANIATLCHVFFDQKTKSRVSFRFSPRSPKSKDEIKKKVPKLPLEELSKVEEERTISRTSPRASLWAAIRSPRSRHGSITKKEESSLEEISRQISQHNRIGAIRTLLLRDRGNSLSESEIKEIHLESEDLEAQEIKSFVLRRLPKRTYLRTLYYALLDDQKDSSKKIIQNIFESSQDYPIRKKDLKLLESILKSEGKKSKLMVFAYKQIEKKDVGPYRIERDPPSARRRLSMSIQSLPSIESFLSSISTVEEMLYKRMNYKTISKIILFFNRHYKESLLLVSEDSLEHFVFSPREKDGYRSYRDNRYRVYEFFKDLHLVGQSRGQLDAGIFVANLLDVVELSITEGNYALAIDIFYAMNNSSVGPLFWDKAMDWGYDHSFRDPKSLDRWTIRLYKSLLENPKSYGKGLILPFEGFFNDCNKRIDGFRLDENGKPLIGEALNTLRAVLANLQGVAQGCEDRYIRGDPFIESLSYGLEFPRYTQASSPLE
jgi:hypothetical protein